MLIERQKRLSRVRFKHPIRVVTLEGQPRVIRTLTANVSRKGLFLRMPEPLPLGTKVALSLEAGGRALALAQAEVVWGRVQQSQLPGRFPGCGVRFTEFMHPRAQELVDYLVHNLDRGKPLLLAPRERPWTRRLPVAGGVALVACAAVAALLLWPSSTPQPVEEAPAGQTIELSAPPSVHPVPSAEPSAHAEGSAPAVPVAEAAPQRVSAAAVAQQVAVDEASPEMAPPAPAATAESPVPPPAVPEVQEAVRDAKIPEAVTPEPLVAKAALAVDRQKVDLRDAKVVASATLDAVARGETPAAAKPAVTSPRSLQRGTIHLPSGAASSLAWTLGGTELRVAPELLGQAQLTRAFVLAGPPRAVFDISGAPPSRSHTVSASPPYATAVRLGKQPSGTRIVIDLDAAPKHSSQDGSALVLSF